MEKKKALAAVMATMLIASSLTACGGTKDTENMDASQTSSAQTQAVSLDGDKTTTVKTVKMGDNDVEVEVTDIGKTGTFTFWSAYTGDSAIWEQKRVDAFNEAYADLGIKCDLQFVPDGAGINNGKLLSAIAGGTAPDLIVTDNSISCYQYAAEGSFMGLDAVLVEIDLDVSSFFEGCKDVMYYNDVCYLIPQDTNVIMLYYNPEIAKECGLDPENPPKTIEELDSWSDAMTVKAADGSYNRLGIVPWLDSGNEAFILPYLFGADPYDKTTGKVDLTSDKMLNYMAWIQGYAKKYDPEKINAFTSGLGQMFSPDHPFMTGKVGMTITGNWFSEALKEYAPDVPYEVCAVPVPEGGRANSTTFGTNVFAIPAGTDPDKAQLAALFIKFAEQGSINEDNFSVWRSIPVIDAAFDDVSLTKNGDEMYALERKIANSPENGIPALCSVSAELSNQFIALRQNMIYNPDADAKAALQTLQDQMQATMDAK